MVPGAIVSSWRQRSHQTLLEHVKLTSLFNLRISFLELKPSLNFLAFGIL